MNMRETTRIVRLSVAAVATAGAVLLSGCQKEAPDVGAGMYEGFGN